MFFIAKSKKKAYAPGYQFDDSPGINPSVNSIMKFHEQIRALRLLFATQALAVLTLLLGTGLTWSNAELLALICVTVGAVFSGLLLLSSRCPVCQDFFFVKNEAEIKTKKAIGQAYTTQCCQKCGAALRDAVGPSASR